MRATPPARPDASSPPRARWLPLASLAAAALVCAGAWGASRQPVNPVAEFARTPVARTFPARTSHLTEYRACTADAAHADSVVPRETCGPATDPPPYLDALAAGGGSLDPESLRASALAGLVWDDREAALDTVVIRLAQAVRLAPDPTSMLVDLSAAHLARALRAQNSRDLVEAVEHADSALSREPRNAMALFNRALALQWQGVREQAALAWDAYLAVDSTSEWAAEARLRRSALPMLRSTWEPGPGTPADSVRAFAAGDPQGARLLGMHRVLGAWGRAVLRGDAVDADAHLVLAERLGATLEDRSLADMVRAIRAAAGDRAATAVLAHAHRDYAEGQRFIGAEMMAEAREPFAKVLNARPRSPVLMLYARAHGAAVRLFDDEPGSPVARMDTVLAKVDTARYPALHARALWIRGTTLGREGRDREARIALESASATFTRLGENEHRNATLGHAGEVAYDLGDTIGAYRLLHRAVTGLAPYGESVQLHNHLNTLARISTQDGMRRAAHALVAENMAVAKRMTHRAMVQFETLDAQARLRAVSGDTAGALRDLRSAEFYANGALGKNAREWADNLLRLARVTVQPHAASLASLDSAAHIFADDPVWLTPTLILRSDVRLARGDTTGAVADLERATALAHAPENDDDPWMRSAVLEKVRERVDQLVMLYVHTGRPVDALRALERGRLSYAPHGRAAALPLRSLRREVALEYALIGDTLVTIAVRSDSVYLVTHRVNRGELLRLIERVGVAMESQASAAALAPRLAELYDMLVRPVKNRLGARDTPLVILADGELAGTPFAALRDGAGGRYLAEDHSLRFHSTLADAARDAAPPRSPGPVLLVADPAFDRTEHPTLKPLAGAEREVDSLRGLYPGSILLTGAAAARDSVLARARHASMIHYAGHAVFDDARPERSYLLLAGAGTDGRLTARAVEGMELHGVRLVVLSACSTLRSRQGRSGGFAGFSGALLRAGAGGVVGSVWKVPDQGTPPLMQAFHRAYRETRDPAEALRRAQKEMLASPDPAHRSPAAWAGFRYAGR